MSTTPTDGPAAPADPRGLPPIPAGYRAGDYVPFKDRDPSNPSEIAGRWAVAPPTESGGPSRPLTADERYRTIYGYDAPLRPPTNASWLRRVAAYLVDAFLGGIVSVPLLLGISGIGDELRVETTPTGQTQTTGQLSGATVAMLLVGSVLVLAFWFYNQVIRQGRTGYTLGKALIQIRLVSASTGQPAGVVSCFFRPFVHVIDSLFCYLGWFWPIWDVKHQTFTDKLMRTLVVIQDPDALKSSRSSTS